MTTMATAEAAQQAGVQVVGVTAANALAHAQHPAVAWSTVAPLPSVPTSLN